MFKDKIVSEIEPNLEKPRPESKAYKLDPVGTKRT
jgi:hypothetical protein